MLKGTGTVELRFDHHPTGKIGKTGLTVCDRGRKTFGHAFTRSDAVLADRSWHHVNSRFNAVSVLHKQAPATSCLPRRS